MKIIAFIEDPRVVDKILDRLDLLESSGIDPPRGTPRDSTLTDEPFYDDLPWIDEVTFPG